ncbi:hypothetical protein DIPPA_29535 [Diplonema papillatum]|nr:hypothetical protein DIPPA_29535 [Diplonema papillatum]
MKKLVSAGRFQQLARRYCTSSPKQAAEPGGAAPVVKGADADAAAEADAAEGSVFTREEIRDMIRRTWEEKLHMGEEEVSKVQENSEPIFQENPLTGYVGTSVGPMPVPFQFKKSSALTIGGFADLSVVSEMLSGEDLHPVVCSDGTTPVAMWIWQHSDATTTVGSHSNSLQLYFFVTREPLPEPPPAHPLIHHALWSETLYPTVRCLPHAMWEESEQALAYNREILGFPSLPALGYVENHSLFMKDLYDEYRRIRGYSFVDTLTGHTIIKGENHYWDGGLQSPTAFFELYKLLGPREALLRQTRRYQRIPLVSPKSSFVAQHADSELLFTCNKEQLRFWGKSKPWLYEDRLLFGKTRWAAMRFTPKWVNHIGGCRGVITPPYNHNGDTNNLRIGWESEAPTFPHLPLAAMSDSARHGRVPAGSPLLIKGVAHLPRPEEVEHRHLQLALVRHGKTLPPAPEDVKHVGGA